VGKAFLTQKVEEMPAFLFVSFVKLFLVALQ
jgi:hypothetical protein